mgnify:CR=1 FL=1
MWPKKKFWWETGGTPPQQSPNPEARVFAGNPMHQWQLGMKMPTVPLRTFDKWDVRRGYDPRFSADTSDTYPNTGPPGSGEVYPNTRPGFGDIRQASQTQTPQYDYTMDASAGSPAKKKGSMIKDIADALKDLDPGPDATPLTGGKFGRGMPAPLGFSLANMGAYVGDPVARQAAMAKARMEEELQRRRKLLGGGY